MNTWWSREQISTLQTGDVMPLPLMVETNWTQAGWEVNVILVTDVVSGGYSSIEPIWSHREPYGDRGAGSAEAERVTDAALMDFGRRLRTVLAEADPGIRDDEPEIESSGDRT